MGEGGVVAYIFLWEFKRNFKRQYLCLEKEKTLPGNMVGELPQVKHGDSVLLNNIVFIDSLQLVLVLRTNTESLSYGKPSCRHRFDLTISLLLRMS